MIFFPLRIRVYSHSFVFIGSVLLCRFPYVFFFPLLCRILSPPSIYHEATSSPSCSIIVPLSSPLCCCHYFIVLSSLLLLDLSLFTSSLTLLNLSVSFIFLLTIFLFYFLSLRACFPFFLSRFLFLPYLRPLSFSPILRIISTVLIFLPILQFFLSFYFLLSSRLVCFLSFPPCFIVSVSPLFQPSYSFNLSPFFSFLFFIPYFRFVFSSFLPFLHPLPSSLKISTFFFVLILLSFLLSSHFLSFLSAVSSFPLFFTGYI